MSNKKHVYFAQKKPRGLIKIGCSRNPVKRLSNLRAMTGEDLKLLYVIVDSGRDEERRLHVKFDEFRTFGEWFKPVKELVGYIKELKENNPSYKAELKKIFNVIPMNPIRGHFKEFNCSIHVKISAEQHKKIKELSAAFGTSAATIIRRYIEIEYGRYKAGNKDLI